jgi:hypothetical protein
MSPAGAKKRAKATPDAARGRAESAPREDPHDTPPPETRQEKAEKQYQHDKQVKTDKTAKESKDARKVQSDLWRDLSAQSEMPQALSPLDAAGSSKVARKFIEHPVGEVVAGRATCSTSAPACGSRDAIVESTRHASLVRTGRLKADSLLAQAAPSAVFAPSTRHPRPGTFPETPASGSGAGR